MKNLLSRKHLPPAFYTLHNSNFEQVVVLSSEIQRKIPHFLTFHLEIVVFYEIVPPKTKLHFSVQSVNVRNTPKRVKK